MLRQKGVFPCIPAYPETPKVAPAQGSTLRQPLSSKSPQANFTATAQAQTASAFGTASRPKESSYETNWNKQELSGFYQYAAIELANKKSCQAVEKSLVSRGASPEIAKKVASEAQSAIKKLRREKYKNRMVRGFLWTIVGVIITCGTYAFADNLGGKFVLLYGAIIFGIIDLVAGLIGWVVNM